MKYVPQAIKPVAAMHTSGAFDMNDMIKDSGIDHSVHCLGIPVAHQH